MNDKRSVMTAADLFVLLDREFRRRKTRECATCFVQLPYRVDAREGNANWEVVIPPQCPLGCSALLEELVDEFQSIYQLGAVERA